MGTDIIAALLLEEEGDDDDTLINLVERSSISQIYKTRSSEGAYNLLIKNHLMKGDGESFVKFLRLNKDQFNFVLELVKEEASKPPFSAVESPITPEEKLALTLRDDAHISSKLGMGNGRMMMDMNL
ncbi:hypothetical protein LSTR_LSTR002653 [Laodelphax striatellus]|uniref:Uncharacterized protein n=1 Tax=Laodelphax striatellus TaxID=195883 RepID=A0A482X6W2_LAOST|nr:hypothetical protein LSTR_LSTR002653 [Laodelphax striatellus]